MLEVQSPLGKEVLDKVQANRGTQRVAGGRGNLQNFAVGEYVLVPQVRRSGSKLKLQCVVEAQRPHVYGVQNIVSEEVRDVHVARIRFYTDDAIAITAELKGFNTLSRKESLRLQRLWMWRMRRTDLD